MRVPFTRQGTLLVICMSKSNKKAGNGVTEPSEPPVPAPRVQLVGPLSLKTQLRIIERTKQEATRPPPKPAVRTKFTKPKPTPEEREEARLEQEREEKENKKLRRPGLRALYGTKGHVNPPILLVDGYNLNGRWIHAYKERPDTTILPKCPTGTFTEMRERLVGELIEYSKHRNVKVMLAFDARLNPMPKEIREMVGGIEVVYVADADNFLHNEADQLRQIGCPRVVVVSDDSEVMQSNFGNEVWPMPCFTLLKDMHKSHKDSKRELREAALNKKHAGRIGEMVMARDGNMYRQLGGTETLETW